MKIQKLLLQIDSFGDYLIWFIATGSIFGSLYFSEIERLQPCMLCWWQRIFMYPIAFIMSVAILRKDTRAIYYVLPLSITGMLLGLYHSLLQWGIVRETVIDCSINSAVSCTELQINWLGFITIPFMSFVAFLGINVMCGLRLYFLKQSAKTEQ